MTILEILAIITSILGIGLIVEIWICQNMDQWIQWIWKFMFNSMIKKAIKEEEDRDKVGPPRNGSASRRRDYNSSQ